MLLSSFGAIFLVFTSLWVIPAILEWTTLIKQRHRLRTAYRDGRIDTETYRKRGKRLNQGLAVNVTYLVIVVLQIGYVVMNWDSVNV
jgi:hypothetical protein